MKHIANRALRTSRILGLSLFLCLILVPVSVQAGELTEQEVQAAVQTWVRHVTADAKPDALIERMEPYVVDGKTFGYIAHLLGGGFCLCGADDLALPVYYYSPQGIYDTSNPFCQYVLQEIVTITNGLTEVTEKKEPGLRQYEEAIETRAAFWQDLIAGRISERTKVSEDILGAPDTMVLSLTCLWHQHSPYNDQCPVLTPGTDEHTLVGCCPLSMAQTMYYWKWPDKGTGIGSMYDDYSGTDEWIEEPLDNDPVIDPTYYWWIDRLEWKEGKLRMRGYWDGTLLSHAKKSSSIVHYADPDYQAALDALYDRLDPGSTTYTVNFGETLYKWSIMEDEQSDPPNVAADAEVAKLCFHAGVAQGAYWGVFCTARGSVGSALEHMKDHFRYDSDAYTTGLNAGNIDTLVEEIQWLRPLIMCGSGHCVNIFGYDISGNDPLLKINNGWGYVGGVSGTGWYTLDTAWPDNRQMSVRLAPESVKFVGDKTPGDGSPGDPYENIEEAIALAPDHATLIFKAGSINTFSGDPLVVNQPLTLKGNDVLIQKK